ncbi:MAG: hypothetical protein BMS9Abin28_2255 [Anaerolineae bacterium]|nr:MAG: hypothetical protein BMS9Abin28_2255 [Anaerolineae bacterium]
MKKPVVYLPLFLIVFGLSACASAAPAPEEAFFESAVSIGAPPAMEFAEDEGIAQSGLARDTVGGFAGNVAPADRVVIRTANLSIVVPEPSVSVQEIADLANELGGFVVSSNVFQTFFSEANVSADRASITIRVPAERLDEALEAIKDGATEIQSENTSGQDVTQEFTDLQSRLRNLEAAEEQLLEIMSAAEETEDVLQVFENLRRVSEEIEVIKGRIQYISESARLSAISVELIPDVAAQPLDIGGWRPEGTVKDAFTALIRALRTLGEAAIWSVICIVPIALILGVPLYFVARTVRRRRAARDVESDG